MRQWCLQVARRHAAADEAQDIAQDAMLRAWRNRERCRCPEHPWPWLATITRNEALRRTRDGGLVPLDDAGEAGGADGALERAPDRVAVWQAVATLTPRDRSIVLLHYGADMTVARVAHELGLPQGTVTVTLQRIRAKLRALLRS